MPDFTLVDLFVVVLFLVYFTIYARGKRQNLPYPPGPKRLPVIGNLLDMPNGSEWITYKRWGQLYGARVMRLELTCNLLIRLYCFQARMYYTLTCLDHTL
jgi:hypothetical protein